MRRLVGFFTVLALCAGSAWAATARETIMKSVPVSTSLPADLVSPEGKTRWHLEDLALGAGEPSPAAMSGADAERWLLPDQDPTQMKMGARVFLDFDETKDGLIDRVHADVTTVGIGWLHLPSGPYEAVLQRVLVSRQRAGERAMRPETLLHRWVGTREGVLAEISGPVAAGGRTRLAVDRIEIAQTVLSAATLKMYSDQLYRGNLTD